MMPTEVKPGVAVVQLAAQIKNNNNNYTIEVRLIPVLTGVN